MNEVFDINKVKVEFLEGIAEEYGQVFTERQLEMSVYMLNEFCNACASNNLVLIRIAEEQLYVPPVPEMQAPPEYQQQGYRMPVADPFQNIPDDRQQIQRTVAQMNADIQRNLPLPPVEEVDLTPDKPKSFAEKIREMRGPPKKQPGNKVNPGDD
jgi:hypothetical protein